MALRSGRQGRQVVYDLDMSPERTSKPIKSFQYVSRETMNGGDSEYRMIPCEAAVVVDEGYSSDG